MSVSPAFPKEELAARLENVRLAMAASDLDGLIVSVPENIYYLTGLDHWGFFACHILVVPRDGRPILVARAMERITAENQVANADFYGHADHEELSDHVVRALKSLGLMTARLGMEKRSLFLTPRHAERILEAASQAQWRDASGLVDDVRLVKSPLEQEYTRNAECSRAMILAGSEYPGFGPFIRPTRRLGEEHTTWRGDSFHDGDAVFLEVGAAYRKYQAPMGRLVYVGHAPKPAEAAAALSIAGMQAIVEAIKPNATAGEVYAAWEQVARDAGLGDYRRHHCGYLVGIGFPPSWTGGSMVTSLAPKSPRKLQAGMVFHAHSWFTDTGRGDDFSYFISNTVMLTETGGEVLTQRTPESLQVR
jgi:Xaa-Pro dipeptidase